MRDQRRQERSRKSNDFGHFLSIFCEHRGEQAQLSVYRRFTGGRLSFCRRATVGRPSGDRRRETEAKSGGKRENKNNGIWQENRGMNKKTKRYM